MVVDSTSKEDVAALMNGEKADLLLTDPPYNVNYEGATSEKLKIQNDNMAAAEFYQFLHKAFTAAQESLKVGGAFYVWYASREHINFESSIRDANLSVRQVLIWVKTQLVMGRQDYHWKHEPCLYGWKEGAAHFFIDDRTQDTIFEDNPNINRMNKEELKAYIKELINREPASTIIREDKPLRNDIHPTMKPVKLFARLIANSSRREEIVLDLFGGSGTTLIACEQLGRKAYLMEYDPRYADAIIHRWEELTGQKAKLLTEAIQ